MARVLPFRPFFILATLDAAVAVGIWIPALAGWSSTSFILGSTAAWHAREMLFGAVPAVLSGFLLTALPRWTGRSFMQPRIHVGLPILWLFGSIGTLLFPVWRPITAAAYLIVMTTVIGHQILVSGSRRNYPVLLLLAMLAAAALIDLVAPSMLDLAFRLGVTAILGLIMVLGGRIVPSLTAVRLELRGKAGLPATSRLVEGMAASAATVALAAWIWSPDGAWTAGLSGFAAVGQGLRWVRWGPWRVGMRPSLIALHGGYACIPLGFAVLALHGMGLVQISATAAVHVWAIGGIGMTSVAVMASMIRKHMGRPLTESPALNSAFLLMGVALVGRVAAELLVRQQDLLLATAAGAWVAAHLLFLAAFARDLLPRRAAGSDRDQDGCGKIEPLR